MSAALAVVPNTMTPKTTTVSLPLGDRANLFARDAALPTEPTAMYMGNRVPWAQARAEWLSQIESERLEDFKLDDIRVLSIDPRDGALCRGKGGLAFTPRAIQQLVGLIRADKPFEKFTAYAKGMAPAGAMAQCLRWVDPATRAVMFADLMGKTQHVPAGGKGQRRGKGEVQLRKFVDRRSGLPALRAVVSGIHALTHTDDKAICAVLDGFDRPIVDARIVRTWDHTYGTFALQTDQPDVSLAFSLDNSETGGVSITFTGSMVIKALDCVVVMPSGTQLTKSVQVADSAGRSKRRHTLPRFNSATGDRLPEAARANIAASRINEDLTKALNSSVKLAECWEQACEDINPLAAGAADDQMFSTVLTDLLLERGFAETSAEVVTVIENDKRLVKLPRGSAAHIAAAFAVLASDGTRTEEAARALQGHAGAFILAGWAAQAA